MARELAEQRPEQTAAEAAGAEMAAAKIAGMNDRVCPAPMDELLDSNIGRRPAEAGPYPLGLLRPWHREKPDSQAVPIR